MDKRGDRLVWLDMEMTGLDPLTCVPIEVALVITDAQLVEIGASYETVIHQPESALQDLVPIVLEMHTANGLLERVRASRTSLEEADTHLAALIAEHCVPGKALLAGNTIMQDRLFIRRYFPKTEALLHYRLLDVSSIKEVVRRWYGANATFEKDSAHTAMADIRCSIAELAHYRKHYFHNAGQAS